MKTIPVITGCARDLHVLSSISFGFCCNIGRCFSRVLGCCLILLIVSKGFATHYRSGSLKISYVSETATKVSYKLEVFQSWELNSAPSFAQFTVSNSGLSSFNVPLTSIYDPSGKWINTYGTYVFSTNKTNKRVFVFQNACCKIDSLENNKDLNWVLYAELNTQSKGNTPIASLPAIVDLPIGLSHASFKIPAIDPDPNSILRFGTPDFNSFSILGQSGLSNPNGFSVDSISGTITLNTSNASIGQLYNGLVTIKDQNNNLISLDFLIRIVPLSTPPVFNYQTTPIDGKVIQVGVGQEVQLQFKASDSDPNDVLSITVSGFTPFITSQNFLGDTLGHLGNPIVTTFNWIPTLAELGTSNILNVIATDNNGVQSTTSVVLKVVSEPPPVFIDSTPQEGEVIPLLGGTPFRRDITAFSSVGSQLLLQNVGTTPSMLAFTPELPTTMDSLVSTEINWTPSAADFGIHTISVKALVVNEQSVFSTRNFNLLVNSYPQILSFPNIQTFEGDLYEYSIQVVDENVPYGDTVIIEAMNLPDWLQLIHTGNGTAILRGTPGPGTRGDYDIHIHVEDSFGHFNSNDVSQEFVLRVLGNQPVAICQNVNLTLDSSGMFVLEPRLLDGGSLFVDTNTIYVVDKHVFDCNDIGGNDVKLFVINGPDTSSCMATVNISDTIAPIIAVKNVVLYLNASGEAILFPSILENGTFDACGIQHKMVEPNIFTCNDLGEKVVKYIVSDFNGNVSEKFVTVVVVDTIKPSLIAPDDIQIIGCNHITGINLGQATVSDNCLYQITNNAPNFFPIGQTEVIWTAQDASGNVSHDIQIVTNQLSQGLTFGQISICKGMDDAWKHVYVTIPVLGGVPAIMTWNWGDGTTSNGTYVNGAVIGEHIYAHPGLQSVNLYVKNECDLENVFHYDFVLVYDPKCNNNNGICNCSSGFVENIVTPSANTENVFTIKTDQFELLSTNYQKHVLYGKSCQIKGLASVNGKRKCRFLVTEEKGNGIVFKIWSLKTGHLIYSSDNKASYNLREDISEEEESDQEGLEVLEIYPNPSNDYFNIFIGDVVDEVFDLQVFDSTGKVVWEKVQMFSNERIQLGNEWPLGVYLVSLKGINSKITLKAIKSY